MLVFGGTGDLALHKLLPALYHPCIATAAYRPDMRILAAARNVLNRGSTRPWPNAAAAPR